MERQSCKLPRSSAFDFVLEATEESIVKQLTELLKTRDLTCDELGLLYCYKHGVSTNQALKTIGIDAKLAALLRTAVVCPDTDSMSSMLSSCFVQFCTA